MQVLLAEFYMAEAHTRYPRIAPARIEFLHPLTR